MFLELEIFKAVYIDRHIRRNKLSCGLGGVWAGLTILLFTVYTRGGSVAKTLLEGVLCSLY